MTDQASMNPTGSDVPGVADAPPGPHHDATAAVPAAAVTVDHAVAPRPPRVIRAVGDDLIHSGMSIPRFVRMHVMGAIFPVTAGLLLYGWRAGLVIVLVVATTGATALIWRSIGLRGSRLRLDHVLWLALLLALMLPAQLASGRGALTGSNWPLWPMLPAAGVLLVIMVWLLGGAGGGRIHPVLIAHLVLVVLFQDELAPRYALRRQQTFAGDVLHVPRDARGAAVVGTAQRNEPLDAVEPQSGAWIAAERTEDGYESVRTIPAAERLESYTAGPEAPERAWISLESLVRDRLPPLEDLIVGGQPAAIGQGSAIAIIIGGLFLLYRGLIDYRVPLLILLSAFVSFLVLPVPVVITETTRVMRWLALRDSSVGYALGVTFANYELMASPLLFTSFFLATAPAVRPLVRRARAIYAVLVGVSAAAFQIYVSVTIGPYLALLAVSLLSPTLDRMFRPRALV